MLGLPPTMSPVLSRPRAVGQPTVPALSVLDLSPVPAGSTASQALRNTLDLARHAERLGLARYWLAEHHNAGGLASSCPEVLIAAVAAATSTIRVGSGGIMLPNHSPLKVAETFRVLSALHPDRIDLGVGRAPGTDKATALALRRSPLLLGSDGFPEQVVELLRLLASDPDPATPFGPVKAAPIGVPAPEVHLLGASVESAAHAGKLGLGYAYAHHFAPSGASRALAAYREAFVPGVLGGACHAIVAVAIVCGESDAHAEELARSGDLSWLRFGQGLRDLPLPSVEEARAYSFDADEETLRVLGRARLIVGGKERVAGALEALVARSGADEIMATIAIHDHEERKRAYERVALGLAR
jgi:luciferase family oxidoreductase group 1